MIDYLTTKPSDNITYFLIDSFIDIFKTAEWINSCDKESKIDNVVNENFIGNGGLKVVEELVNSENIEISAKAVYIMETYFREDIFPEHRGGELNFKNIDCREEKLEF